MNNAYEKTRIYGGEEYVNKRLFENMGLVLNIKGCGNIDLDVIERELQNKHDTRVNSFNNPLKMVAGALT